ncbi:MAG TPA: hypothetical protein VEB63_07630 [Chitinophagaceae bacterium]|nr:hypothetical protein [Chitinophagaceae bacterium]
MVKFFFLTGIFLLFFSTSVVSQDTSFHRKVTVFKDTTVVVDDDTTWTETYCMDDFFETNEKVTNPARTYLVTKSKKTISLKTFLNTLAMAPDHMLKDLDGDGKKELVISHFTGGMHCCDEVFVYRPVAPNKYQYVFKTFAGNACMTEDGTLAFDFYESYGYFFTCYACAYADTSEPAPIAVTSIRLRYHKGKVQVVPSDPELRSRIRDNLAKLSEKPYQPLREDFDQDDGLRKAFALNLAVYHYTFGRNLATTKKLFDQFYKFPDAKVVWGEFVRLLNWIRSKNDF